MKETVLPERIRLVIGANDLLLAGVQRLVIDQLTTLDRKKFDIHLIILRQFSGKETFDDKIPSDVIVHRLAFSGIADIGEWKRVYRLLKEIRPKVVKTATFFSNTTFLVLQPFFRYVVVAAEHNTVNAKPFWQRVVDRLLLPRAYTIIADSQMVVDFVSSVEWIPRKHFTVVYNGVDLDAVEDAEQKYFSQREVIRSELGIPSEAPVIFTAARIVKQKNHILMVEGFARLLESHPSAYLVIAGDGGLRGDVEARAVELGVSEKVILLGEQKDVHRYYAIADIFLLTSRHEGFCIAAMEGLAFGMPLISTRVAGVSEYLKDGVNGYFVDDTPKDIAEKLLKIVSMSNEELAQFARAGKEVAKNYDIDRYGKAVGNILESAAAIRKGA